jgi:putative protease
MTCEDGVSVPHPGRRVCRSDQAEKALANLRDGVAKLGQTIYYARDVQINLPALFVPNSLLNQLRRETAECWMTRERRRAAAASRSPCRRRSTRRPIFVPRQRL